MYLDSHATWVIDVLCLFLTHYPWVFLQQGTGSCAVDWCRNLKSVLYICVSLSTLISMASCICFVFNLPIRRVYKGVCTFLRMLKHLLKIRYTNHRNKEYMYTHLLQHTYTQILDKTYHDEIGFFETK